MKKLLLLAVLSLHFYASAVNYCTQENLDIQLEVVSDLKFNFEELKGDLHDACGFESANSNCSKLDLFIDRYNAFFENETELKIDIEKSHDRLSSLEIDCAMVSSKNEKLIIKAKEEIKLLKRIINSNTNDYSVNKSDCYEKIINFQKFCK